MTPLGRYLKPYSRPRLKEMGYVGWWVELGLHRGLIAEETKKRAGVDGPYEYVVRYYNLGPGFSCIGFLDPDGRRAFNKVNFANKPWFDEWDLSSKEGPLQGPAIPEKAKGTETSSRLKKVAKDALIKIKEGVFGKPRFDGAPKPTLRLPGSGKPRLAIAHEDRPDVGAPKSKPFLAVRVSKPRLRLKSKPLFRIKGDD